MGHRARPVFTGKVWKTRNRMRVKGTINGFAFRTSLFGSAEKGYVVLVNKTMQKGAQAYAGEMAEFTLEPDLEAQRDRPAGAGEASEAGPRTRKMV